MEITDLIQKYIVFVDTSSWMYTEGVKFLEQEFPAALHSHQKKVRISGKVIEEVNKHIKGDDKKRAEEAKVAAKLLNQYHKHKILEIYQDPDDPFQDQAILAMFMKYRTKFNLAMITQDRNFARDIEDLNDQGSVKSSKIIKVFYLDREGKLQPWVKGVKQHELDRKKRETAATPTSDSSKTQEKIHRLPLGTKVETGLDIEIPVSHFPKEGESVLTGKFGELTLVKEIGSGGEGSVFLTSNGMICKVYTQITKARIEKLKLMLKIPFEKKGICWPKDFATNSQGEYIGYVMEKAEGKVMQTSMFHKKLLQKNFPHWTRSSLVELAITILDKIQYLHERNIIIGDINPFNIMIKDSNDVYFVDTDSYQIVNYPCPVGTINFTPPETQGMRYHEYLRTFKHEYFAVATLVFMILMPGKTPYAQQGGGTPGEDIKKMEFPYPFGDYRGNAPDGAWRYIWSHFTYAMKKRFFQVFSENNRLTTVEWISALEEYRRRIHSGHSNDEIWPTSNKIADDDAAHVTCSKCNSPFIMHINKKSDLDASGKSYICNSCLMIMKVTKVAKNEAAAAKQTAPRPRTTMRSTTQRPRQMPRPMSSTWTPTSTRPTSSTRPASSTRMTPPPRAQQRQKQNNQQPTGLFGIIKKIFGI